MPATRKEESTVGGRGGECDESSGRAAAAAAVGGSGTRVGGSGSAYPVADGDERGAASLPTLDPTVHTIYRSPSMGAWMPDGECGGGASNVSRYSLLPPPAPATASIQQMESAAAMMKLAYRNRLHDRMPPGAERRNSTPGGDVTGGSEGGGWRLPAAAWAGAAAAGAVAEAPAPLRGDPEVPRPQGRLPLADVCEASVARQRAPREPSSSSDEGLGLDRQPSLTDLRSLDSESCCAAALPATVGRHRPRGLHEAPLSGHRLPPPPHEALRAGRQLSASTTFHGLPSSTFHGLPSCPDRGPAGHQGAADGLPPPDAHHDTAGMAPPVDYQMWSSKIVELQQMSDSLTQGIANFIRIAASNDPQYKGAVPPGLPGDRLGSTENRFEAFDGSSSIGTPRTLFSRSGPAVDPECLCDTMNARRDNCAFHRLSCAVSPRYEDASSVGRGAVPRSPQCGSYLYRDEASIRGPPRVGVGDAVGSLVTVATAPSLRGVGLDANEVLKRQSAEISGDVGGCRPGVIPRARRQCTGESGDFEPPGPLVNSETTSSVEMCHCSRNCICKDDCPYAARTSTDTYPNDLPTLTLFERTDDSVETCAESAVGVSVCEAEEAISAEIRKKESSSTNETPEDSIGWVRSARSETAICSHTSDFVAPDTGLNYTFPPSISGIDEMRAVLMKERKTNAGESLESDKCNERDGEVGREPAVAATTELKREEGDNNLTSSKKNTSGCSLDSSVDSSGEPSYSLDQHFLPTIPTSCDVHNGVTDRGDSKINNDVQNERNELDSKSFTINIARNDDTVENFKNEHIGYSPTGCNKPSTSSVFKTVTEDRAMENICISTCALKTLLSGHGIMEDVKEMSRISIAIPETKEKEPHFSSFRQSTSSLYKVPENEVQSDTKENGRQDAPNRETCKTAHLRVAEKDIYDVSDTGVGGKAGAGLYGKSITVLASERDMATSEDRSRSATPTEDCRDDSASGTTSASTSLFGSVIRWVGGGGGGGGAAAASNSSSDQELVAPTNSFEDVPNVARRYDARETLNLVRDLIWKDSAYSALRPEHDVESPSTPSGQQGAAGAATDRKAGAGRPAGADQKQAGAEQKQAGAEQKQPRAGVRTVWQPRHHRLRHDRSSQTCVAVREFPNIPATQSLQRTVKTTNLKGPPKAPTVSPRPVVAARLQQKPGPTPLRSGPAVPGGWPAVSARPLARPAPAAHAPATHAPATHAHGQSRSAGSSPRVPANRGGRDVCAATSRSKDASAADALLADAASLFRAKLDACDRKPDPRRPQKTRPLSAAARLSSAAPPGTANYLRMARAGASVGRRQPVQEQESWQQRQQQLQQRQLQLQQRQQMLQQRQLQLQQRQQLQQRHQLLQRQQRVQQTASWQQRLSHAQLSKPAPRRPPASRAGDAAGGCGTESSAGVASLRMLQARLRAGGSLHRGFVAVAAPEPEEDKARSPPPEVEEEEEEEEAGAEVEAEAAPDCPTRDRSPQPREAAPPLPQPEQQQAAPQAEPRDADDTDNSREPVEAPCQSSNAVCAAYSDTTAYSSAGFLNPEVRVSDLSLLSEQCTLRFVNYLPSAPVREIEEEDLFREIMFSGPGNVFPHSCDTLPLLDCAYEMELRDFIKPLDRVDSESVVSIHSEHLIDPPAEFCGDENADAGGESTLPAQTTTDTRDRDGGPTDSIPAALSHADDACSTSSSSLSIPVRDETDTSCHVARTTDSDQSPETIGMTSESDANGDSSDEDNATVTPSSDTQSPSILGTERTLDHHTERQNDMSEGKSLHEDDPVLFASGSRSNHTISLTLGETDNAGGFDAEKSSPQHTDFPEKFGNDLMNAISAEETGSAHSSSKVDAYSILPVESSSPGNTCGKEDRVRLDSYVEPQTANYNESNKADTNQDENNLDALAKPSCTGLPIASSLEKICDETAANSDVAHKPSIREITDVVETNEVLTEQNEGENNTPVSLLCDSLSPTSSSEYTDCSYSTEKIAGFPTDGTGNQNDPETNSQSKVQNTSASLLEEEPLASVLSQESSLTPRNPSTDNDSAASNTVEANTTVEEECREIIPCDADDSSPNTAPCLTQDVLIDVPQTEKCLADVAPIKLVNKTPDDEENNGTIDTVSQDLQDDDSFRDAEDDMMSIKSLNNDDLTDVSSVSDLFSATQFFSDGDEGPSSPVVDTATSSRPSDEPSINNLDECFNSLRVTLRCHAESELQGNFREELNKTDFDNNDSTEINEKTVSLCTDTTSYAIEPRSRTPETWSEETDEAYVLDVVPSATSWVTVSTVSFSEIPLDEANMFLTSNIQNKVGSSQEHVNSSSENNSERITDTIVSSELLVETNISSIVTTGVDNKVVNSTEQVENSFHNIDEIYAIRSTELVDEESTSCLAVTATESNEEIKEENVESSSNNEHIEHTEAHESYITPSSELLVEAITSYFAMIGAQTILEHMEGSSDNTEYIQNSVLNETYTLRQSASANEANISPRVVTNTENKVESNEERVESSSDNVEHIQDTATQETNVAASSELLAKEITSSILRNIFEHLETSSDNTECTRDLAEGECYTKSSETADEANFRHLAVSRSQNKIEVTGEHVQRSPDIAECIQCAATHESYATASSQLPVEAVVGDQTKLEGILEDVERSSDDAERIRHLTTYEMDTPEKGATPVKQEGDICRVVSSEEMVEGIPLGEASASWETLSEHSCASEEDSTDNARPTSASSAGGQHQRRRRRHRRESQWRLDRAEDGERPLLDLTLASPEVEVHLSEALAHSDAEQPFLSAGPRLSAVGGAGPDAEALAAALAGVAMADADAAAEGATDILYGTRDLHSAAVEAAVACVVDSELRDLSALYVQRLGGCLLVGADAGADSHQQTPDQAQQIPTPPEDGTRERMADDSSSATTPVSESTTPPASPPRLESAASSCSLHPGPRSAPPCAPDASRSQAIATLLTLCVFLAAYSSCLLLDPRLLLP